KVHLMMDSASGLPVMLTVTKAGYENRTVRWFIRMLLKLGVSVGKFLADAAYDSNITRLMIVKKLKIIPFIPLNARNCKGRNEEEKKGRRKKLCLKFYAKKYIKNYWIDPDSAIR
ncbi:MAG: hypothetical protein QW769_08865, partial [Nitrososphaerales archaeon]